jgi:FixJ family two-component response regulator
MERRTSVAVVDDDEAMPESLQDLLNELGFAARSISVTAQSRRSIHRNLLAHGAVACLLNLLVNRSCGRREFRAPEATP